MKDTEMRKRIRRIYTQEETSLNLIASENSMHPEVKHIHGWERITKYCEGYGTKRYYSGCEAYNDIEELTKKRALQLFGLSEDTWDVIVQPYSGSIANLAIYMGCLGKNGSICALDMMAGGHLSHGSKASITSSLFSVYPYGLTDSYDIDYVSLETIAKKEKPRIIVSGASAFPGAISFSKIGKIAKTYGSIHMADISHYAGLISAGLYPSPFPHADIVMSTTHKTLWGPRGACIFVKKKSGYTELIMKSVFPGIQGGPHMDVIAAMGTGFLVAKKSSRYYKRVIENADILYRTLHQRGCHVLGKTQSHMVLVSLDNTTYTGTEAQDILENIGILSNKNMIQGDSSPLRPLGIRFGTYAITQRNIRTKEMKLVAETIADILQKKISRKEGKKRVSFIMTKLTPLERQYM